MSPSDQELLAIARAAADAGAAELSRYWGNLSQVRSKGRAGDLVTEADLAAEAAVLQLLRERTPCLLYTSPSPRDKRQSRMPSSA